MHQVTSGGSDTVYTCPHCSSLYLMTMRRSAARNNSCAVCEWCDRGMVEWNSLIVPMFAFVVHPSNDNKRCRSPHVVE